jgi:hypothetical protein
MDAAWNRGGEGKIFSGSMIDIKTVTEYPNETVTRLSLYLHSARLSGVSCLCFVRFGEQIT